MQLDNENLVQAQSLTSGEGNYFFGYYDIPAYSKNEKYHLCHRTGFYDRLQTGDDKAEIGMIELETGKYIHLADTYAWNFQQGSMLQWNPGAPDDEIIFNIREENEYRGVIMNVHTGKKRILESPVANVDPKGRYALGVNFSRMFDFRPGYGYAGIPDRFSNLNHPCEDGVFLIDIITGKSKLIISLHELWEFTKHGMGNEDVKMIINHIACNTDGSRFLMLCRSFTKEDGSNWGTALVTAAADGSDLFCLADYGVASHYNWRDPEHLMIYSGGSQGVQLYLLKDKAKEAQAIDEEYFLRDGHCSYSPDRKWILYDSYPDEHNYRHLYLYNISKKRGILLGSYFSDPRIKAITNHIRCDLHPRWSRSGSSISFDSIHEGKRDIYTMDLRKYLL